MNNSFFNRFTPKEPKFFPLLKQLSDVMIVASDLLIEMMKHGGNHAVQLEDYKKIKDQERAGDKLSHQVFDDLNTTFITPFDREDIHALATRLDDVIDGINSCAKRIALYNPKLIPDGGVELAKLIKECSVIIGQAMNELDTLRKTPVNIKKYCTQLHDLENKADDVYEQFVIRLFEHETDGVEVIKQKEIMYELEKTTDAAELVGKVIKTIIVKYA